MKRVLLVLVLLLHSVNYGAVKDFFSEPETRCDINSLKNKRIYKFGFYETNSSVPQIINLKSTYIHASPFSKDDEGVIFLSSFDANTGTGFGKVIKKSDGSYDGVNQPFVNTSTTTKDSFKKIWYYQILKGENAGDIYKIHEYSYTREPLESTEAKNMSNNSTYCFNQKPWVFVLGTEYSGGSRHWYACIIDLSLLSDISKTDYYYKKIEITPPTAYKNGFWVDYTTGANSLEGLASSTKLGRIEINKATYINSSNDRVSICGFVELDLSQTSSEMKVILEPSLLDLEPSMADGSINTGYGEAAVANGIDQINNDELNHILLHPDYNNSLIIFNDENSVPDYEASANKEEFSLWSSALYQYSGSSLINNLKGTGTNSAQLLYKDLRSEHLTHFSFSADGTRIYACRAESGFDDAGNVCIRPAGLIRFKSDIGLPNNPDIEQLYTHNSHYYSGAHQDHTIDDKFSTIEFKTVENNIADIWEIVTINNDTKSKSSEVKYSMHYLSGATGNSHPDHPWHPHQNFSLTGDFIAFTYQTACPGNIVDSMSVLGVIASDLYENGNRVLPIDHALNLKLIPANLPDCKYPLLISQTEITQDEYCDVIKRSTSSFSHSGLNIPATNVTYYDAILYCNAKSKKDKLDTIYTYTSANYDGEKCVGLNNLVLNKLKNGYRIPTKEEWEYCYLGGVNDNYNNGYYWPSHTDSTAALYANYGYINGSVLPVGSLRSNKFGLYDMAGNVSEWVTGTDGSCAIMNGSYASQIQDMPYNAMGYTTSDPTIHNKYNGFRVVRRTPDITPAINLLLD